MTERQPARPAREEPVDGLRFVDPDDLARAERLIRERSSAPCRTALASAQQASQFRLLHLLVVTFLACIGLSGAHWVPATTFAGLAGFFAICVLGWTALAFPRQPWARAIWLGATLAYAGACAMALLRLPK